MYCEITSPIHLLAKAGRWWRGEVIALAAALFLLCASPAARAQTPLASSNTLPRIVYRERILPNGLILYAVERHGVPTVSVQVWYRVGSKNDPPNRSGFAHLFEHLMFKSTKNQPAESFDRLTEDIGGTNNAYTEADRTVFHEEVPSNYLESILWAESDRMANLNVDESNFKSERSVVEEEYRQSVLANPYGRLYELLLPRLSYIGEAYGRATIGSIEDLERASLTDVRKFHATYYRPDNAVVVVVGDFDPRRLDLWADRYLARIPKPGSALPVTSGAEPLRIAGPSRYDRTAPGVPLPALLETYLTPGVASPDAPALRIADVLLSQGESSRLYRSLVYEQQVASDIQSDADLNADAGLFEVGATAASGKSLDVVQKALLSEVDRLKNEGPTPEELTKARNQLIAGALRERETNEGLAAMLGNAVVMLGDPERINTDVATLSAVTADDVKAVLTKYVTEANRVEIRYSAQPTPPEGGSKK